MVEFGFRRPFSLACSKNVQIQMYLMCIEAGPVMMSFLQRTHLRSFGEARGSLSCHLGDKGAAPSVPKSDMIHKHADFSP